MDLSWHNVCKEFEDRLQEFVLDHLQLSNVGPGAAHPTVHLHREHHLFVVCKFVGCRNLRSPLDDRIQSFQHDGTFPHSVVHVRTEQKYVAH